MEEATTTQQQSVSVENLLITANVNTVQNAIAFNKRHNILAMAAANSILICDPNGYGANVPRVLFSLRGHLERVNGLQWLNEDILVSVSSDKSFIVWSFTGEQPRHYQSWTYKRVYSEAHAQAINYLTTYTVVGGGAKEFYILTMCTGGVLKLWQGEALQAIEFKEQLLFGKNLQEALGLIQLGEKHLMLAIGGYDINIHIYMIPRMGFQGKTFKYKFSLLGHQNAIRYFSFTQLMKKEVQYMASCSQDSYIRIWKIQPLSNVSDAMGGHEDLQKYESKTSFILKDDMEDKIYNITLESILNGHQESVSTVAWGVKSTEEGKQGEVSQLSDFCLLSSSFDFTVCVWKPDEETGIWSVESTLGAMQGNKHAYYGAQFLSDDQEILAYTFNGAMHNWKRNAEGRWLPKLTVKGHFGEVTDMDWDQHQVSLMSCSQDQTTRLFSKYATDKGWFEFSRPQVHGYNMNTLATLPVKAKGSADVNLPSKILSGGDEKVLRLFESPFSYVKIFNQLNPEKAAVNLRLNETQTNEEIEKLIGAEVKKQPLGLMNKPVMVLASQNTRVDEEEGGGIGADFDPMRILSNTKDKVNEIIEDLVEPPVEDVLMSRTLWPEQQKLYGHAFEVFCVATSHQGDCAASASIAKEKKYADVIIWDLRKGQTSVPSCKLSAHTLTVVQLEFSKCDNYLLSCSRDRSWALFKRSQPEELQFTLLKKMKDAHLRIIWGVNWSHEDALFATASREKQKSVKLWHGIGNQIGELYSELPEENPSATAVRFFPNLILRGAGAEAYGLLVGLESGDINVWAHSPKDKTWSKIYQLPEYLTHCLAVRRIKFNTRYSQVTEGKEEYTVATCSDDHSVRIFALRLF